MLRGVLYLITCNLLWATNNIAGRWLSPYLDPFTITAIRWVLATPLYPLILGPGILRSFTSYMGLRSFILGILGFTLFNFTLYWSLSQAPAYLVGFAYGFTPIIMISLSFILGESRISRFQVVGALLSTLGVSILFTWRGLIFEDLGSITGVLGGLLAGFIWSLYTVLQSKFYPNSDRASLTYASLVQSLPVTLVISYPWLSNARQVTLSYDIVLVLIWIALMPGALAYYLWNKAIALLGSSTAAPYSNLLPVFIAILGYAILGEILTPGDIIGGTLVVLGSTIALVTSGKR